MSRALLIIDVQNDFCPGGALPVNYGDRIIPAINAISGEFDRVIATQDWHPHNHLSFARSHRKPAYSTATVEGVEQVLWPVHCVAGTFGAQLRSDLNLEPVNLILRKGLNPRLDSYSAFLENDRKTETGLSFYLKGLGISELYLCGLALDFCVYYSALDARALGFATYLIEDATKGINAPGESVSRAMKDMTDRGVVAIRHEELRVTA
jgi:nicotinamidase/pyrazinamidase